MISYKKANKIVENLHNAKRKLEIAQKAKDFAFWDYEYETAFIEWNKCSCLYRLAKKQFDHAYKKACEDSDQNPTSDEMERRYQVSVERKR